MKTAILFLLAVSAFGQNTNSLVIIPKTDLSATGSISFRDKQTTSHNLKFSGPDSIASDTLYKWDGSKNNGCLTSSVSGGTVTISTGSCGSVAWPLVVPGGTAAPQIDASALAGRFTIQVPNSLQIDHTDGEALIINNAGGASITEGYLLMIAGARGEVFRIRATSFSSSPADKSAVIDAPGALYYGVDYQSAQHYFYGASIFLGLGTSGGSWTGNVYVNRITDDSSGARLQLTGFMSSTVGYYSAGTASNTVNIPVGGVLALNFTAGSTTAGGTSVFAQNDSVANATIYAKNYNASGVGFQDDSANGSQFAGKILINNSNSGRVQLGSSEWQPATDNVVSLGDPTARFANGFFGGSVEMSGPTNYLLGGGTYGSSFLDVSNGALIVFETGSDIQMKGGSTLRFLSASRMEGDFIPNNDAIYALGSNTNRFTNLSLSGEITHIHGINTQSFGVPVVVYSFNGGGLTSFTSQTVTVNGGTPPSGLYRINASILLHNCAGGTGVASITGNWRINVGTLAVATGPSNPVNIGCSGTSHQSESTWTIYYAGTGAFSVGTNGPGFVAFSGGETYDFAFVVERLQ